MSCPFLKEATVRFCQSAPFAKALPRASIAAGDDRCTRPDHATCPYAVAQVPVAPAGAACPSLAERRVQYCAAVSLPRFIPNASVLPSRCSTDAYRHCAVYLEWVGQRPGVSARPCPRRAEEAVETVDGITVPLDLAYAPNHLWLERGADGTGTIGVDGFLLRVIGHADRVTFVPSRPGVRPFVVLSVGGVELPLAFPLLVERTGINYSLRSGPGRLSDDPYGSGWLFEGYLRDDVVAAGDPTRPLVSGRDAVTWMQREVDRLSGRMHDELSRSEDHGLRAAADGGTFAGGLARTLRREDALRLFAEFFPVPPTF
jgi:glycine cleavage system H lipoate-binding protein